jgi:hypothetical protein
MMSVDCPSSPTTSASRAGVRAEADFLRDVARWLHELMQIIGYAKRAADLVEQYSDLPLGTADAIVIAIAGRSAR